MTDSQKLDLLIEEVCNLKVEIKTMDSRFDQVDSRLDQMDSRLDQMDSRLDQVDSRLDRVENRLDVIELKQDRTARVLGDLQLDVKIAERNISRNIHILNDEMETVIEVLRQKELLPRRA